MERSCVDLPVHVPVRERCQALIPVQEVVGVGQPEAHPLLGVARAVFSKGLPAHLDLLPRTVARSHSEDD